MGNAVVMCVMLKEIIGKQKSNDQTQNATLEKTRRRLETRNDVVSCFFLLLLLLPPFRALLFFRFRSRGSD